MKRIAFVIAAAGLMSAHQAVQNRVTTPLGKNGRKLDYIFV